ncbi:nuclear transport factor 2 family protein [Deinococcus aquiradiocola]|uniref:nuclear transport factor 2 family protein n=1 Tax=Deinococcus aquiradiocola TaxID=393059 RepID=UPI001666CC2E|nr:nuclear transport factor 2 family protein [Deinococcus aquiradiocola]
MTHLHQAMVDARTDVLEDLLDPGYTLTHLTGEVQPREAWFAAIRSRAFEYHHIREVATAVALEPDVAVVTGRGIVTATIHGMRHPWRLAFVMRFVRTGGRWVAMNAQYSTW